MSIPERKNHVELTPASLPLAKEELHELVSISIGTTIMNAKAYEKIAGNKGKNFKPWECDPIRVVWVKTKQGRTLMIEDGHHRAKAVLDNLPYILKHYPEFRLTYRDVTTDYLSPKTTEPTEPALSMQEYFRILVPPTKAQEEVAKQRTAAYIITYWETLADEELAEKLPALTALTLLAKHTSQKQTLADFLKGQHELFTNKKHIDALVTMETFIKDMNLSASTIAKEALELIVNNPETIGGKEQAFKQIESLSYLPSIQAKIQRETSNTAATTTQLKEKLFQAVSILPKDKPAARVERITSVKEALENTRLSLSETFIIIGDINPKEKLKAVLHEKDIAWHTHQYKQSLSEDRPLTPTEQRLLRKLISFDTIRDVLEAEQTLAQLPEETQAKLQKHYTMILNANANVIYARLNGFKAALQEIQNTARKEDPACVIEALQQQLAEKDQVIKKLTTQLQEAQSRLQQAEASARHFQELLARKGKTPPHPPLVQFPPPQTKEPTTTKITHSPKVEMHEEENDKALDINGINNDQLVIPKNWFERPLARNQKLSPKQLDLAKAVANGNESEVCLRYNLTVRQVRNQVETMITQFYLPTLPEKHTVFTYLPQPDVNKPEASHDTDTKHSGSSSAESTYIPGLTWEEQKCLEAVEKDKVEEVAIKLNLTSQRVRTVATIARNKLYPK